MSCLKRSVSLFQLWILLPVTTEAFISEYADSCQIQACPTLVCLMALNVFMHLHLYERLAVLHFPAKTGDYTIETQ